MPYTDRRPYFIQIEQQSISKEYFSFWKTVETQINNTGGIFDNPPSEVIGNFYNPQDTTEAVLGYFAAIGTTFKAVYLNRSGFPSQPAKEVFNRNLIFIWSDQCQFSLNNPNDLRTTIKPKGWKD
ncbi:MAG: DUF4249 family protein [Saprospiraceae bacterium]|nr:DUF4249 family protein [Saprospiraceae bacterium]